MERGIEAQQEILNRLRSAAGHISGIERMVQDDKYCIDILHQVQAVQAALNKVSLLLLDDHMHHCVTDAIRSEDSKERERVLTEIRDVFAKRSRL